MGIKVAFKEYTIIEENRRAILKFLDDVCRENGLDYFAYAQLLVGAVYYQDFIPNGFKSSVEIGLMRKDYVRLVRLLEEITAEEECPFRIRTVDKNNNPNFQCRVILDIHVEYEEFDLDGSTQVIISAFDYVPDSIAQKKYFYRKLFFKREKYKKLARKFSTNNGTSLKPKAIYNRIKKKIIYANGRLPKIYKKVLRMASSCSRSEYIRRLVPKFGQEIPYSDIFPTVRMKLGDIEISAPNNHSWWAADFDEELMLRTRTIQKIDLAIMQEFDRVCREIGVGYFICGGTMLGYMRHGGFIPWDDDVDVGMLRADYDRFLEEAPKYLNEEDFFLQTRATDPKIPYLFSKIRMNETEYITKYNELRDFHKGICLDIFPFDFIPDDPAAQNKFRSQVRRVEKIHNKVVNKAKEKPIYNASAFSFAEMRARIVNESRRKLVRMIPLEWTQKLYIKTATRYNATAKEKGLTNVASFVPTYTHAVLDEMLPYQDVYFEGIRVMALKDMDTFLTMQYKNYMELPEIHKRVGHDLIRWSISDHMAEKYHIYDEV